MFEDLLNLLSGKRNATAQPQGMKASGAVQKALSQPLQKMPARPMQGMAPMAQPPQGWQGETMPQRQAAPRPTQFDENRFRANQFDVPFGFPIPGGSNRPRLYEDGTYGRDSRGGLSLPQGRPGVSLYEDDSYLQNPYRPY